LVSRVNLCGLVNDIGPITPSSLGDILAHQQEERVDPTRPPGTDPYQSGVPNKDKRGHDLLITTNQERAPMHDPVILGHEPPIFTTA
ncbi:hypothetical protein PIB30_096907, partial [Stylosanthes scabra]|nr:hypothetical protein [Stylosanthes scabra]